MEHKEKATKIQFTVADIIDQVSYHIEFLRAVDNLPELKTQQCLELAAYRYEKYWLPLAAQYSKTKLVAPLDIGWMWHCHMLSPLSYIQDCTSLVGKVVSHTLQADPVRAICRDRTRQLWSQKHDGEPFYLDFDEAFDDDRARKKALIDFRSKLSYNIVGASQRQRKFLYNVSLPHYGDKKFMENSLTRYKQFLYLKVKFPDRFLVPCYDIDLIWHTHMLNPVQYASDTMRIVRETLHHDDSVTERGEGSKLHIGGQETMNNWNSIFKEKYKLPGTLNRGQSSQGLLYTTETHELSSYCVIEKATLCVEKIMIRGPKINRKNLDTMFLSLKTICKSCLSKETILEGKDAEFCCIPDEPDSSSAIWTVQKCVANYPNPGQETWTTRNIMLDVEPNRSDSLTLRLSRRKSWGFFRKELRLDHIIETTLKFHSIQTHPGTFDNVTFRTNLGLFHVDLVVSLAQKNIRNVLFLQEGHFSAVTTVAEVKEFLHDKTEEEVLPYLQMKSITAHHRLLNIKDHAILSVRIFHCASLMTSRIQVLCGDNVVVIGQLISSNQLPMPSQVDGDIPTLNPSSGERAVLIQNNEGDWAVVIGGWVGYKRGKAHNTVQRCIVNDRGENIVQERTIPCERGNSGDLEYVIYRLPSLEKSSSLPSYLEVDYQAGIIKMSAEQNQVAENIALVFSVSLLHVLCVPRRRDWKEGENVTFLLDSYFVKHFTNDKFISATGIAKTTPSNHYMKTELGEKVCSSCGFGDSEVFNDSTGDSEEFGDSTDVAAGFDGCACGVSNLRLADCAGSDESKDDARWRTVGKNEAGVIIPIRRCGRFANHCSCDICEPKPKPEPESPGHGENCKCISCQCGVPQCMHFAR